MVRGSAAAFILLHHDIGASRESAFIGYSELKGEETLQAAQIASSSIIYMTHDHCAENFNINSCLL